MYDSTITLMFNIIFFLTFNAVGFFALFCAFFLVVRAFKAQIKLNNDIITVNAHCPMDSIAESFYFYVLAIIFRYFALSFHVPWANLLRY